MSCVASQTPLMLRSQNQKRNRLFTLSLSCLLHWQQPPRHQRGLFSRSSTSSHSFTDVHPLSPSSCPPSSLLSICESSSSQPPSPLRLFTVINFTVTWQSKACFFRAERSELGVVTERQLIGACHRTNERSLCEIHKHRGRSALATQILTFLIFLCCFQVTKLHFFFCHPLLWQYFQRKFHLWKFKFLSKLQKQLISDEFYVSVHLCFFRTSVH